MSLLRRLEHFTLFLAKNKLEMIHTYHSDGDVGWKYELPVMIRTFHAIPYKIILELDLLITSTPIGVVGGSMK